MARHPPFADREEAGRMLAAELPALERPIVLGLPRGGVPVAAAVASAIGAPFDVFVVRKLGLPAQPELAMGAVASGGVQVLNHDVLRQAAVPSSVLEDVAGRELAEVAARDRLYRGDRPAVALAGRDVVVVDDGLATGATMRAAVFAVRSRGPRSVVAAVPVAPRETVAAFERDGIRLVCPLVPREFASVGSWYRDFGQVTDEEVIRLIS
ncbi:MAG TPA: phosphoribosyltransferase family protein [Gaiellaceae bacterium]|nr:phosphoribosyltransferase family protein [Gaiellaceae bacterium]